MNSKNVVEGPEIRELVEYKEKSGWSYEKIAIHMGVHSQTIVFWLTGKTQPSPMAREKIRTFLSRFSG